MKTKHNKSVQIGIRITLQELITLREVLENERSRLKESGIPGEVTISTLVRAWLKEAADRLYPDEGEPRTSVRSAPNVDAARAKIRRGR